MRCRSCPARCRHRSREEAATYQKAVAQADSEYALAKERLKAFEEDLRDSKRHTTASQRTELAVLRHQAHLRHVPIPRLPALGGEAAPPV